MPDSDNGATAPEPTRLQPASGRVFTTYPNIPRRTIPPTPFDANPQKWVPVSASVLAGGVDTFHVDFDVETWFVAVVPAAGVRFNVYPGSAAAGPGLPIGGGGSARVPGNGPDLSYSNVGSNTGTIVAIACIGYRWLEYDPGELA